MAIYHKKLKRLNYVTSNTVGVSPVEIVLDWWDIEKAKPLPTGYSVDLSGQGKASGRTLWMCSATWGWCLALHFRLDGIFVAGGVSGLFPD